MCVRCHMCTWRRQQAKRPAGDVLWNPHFDAVPVEIPSVAAVHTPDPPMLLNHLHDDQDLEGVPSTAMTPLQAGAGHRKPAGVMADELNQKLRSLQLQQGMDSTEKPSRSDGFVPGLGADSCRTLETNGMVNIAQPILSLMKLPVPPLSSAPETLAVHMQDEGVEPPPPLPLVSREQAEEERGLLEGRPVVISLGSVGHPHNCSSPCKYVKRKNGCSNGTACQNCHQCKWTRDRSKTVSSVINLSAGSEGHPGQCGQPCKYVRRKSGCHSGDRCPNCHVCQWRRQAQPDEQEEALLVLEEATASVGELNVQLLHDEKTSKDALALGVPPTVQFPDTALVMASHGVAAPVSDVSDLWPSIGSVGHPHTCAGLGCKYSGKARGCKDGNLCTRCHLCRWSRYESSACKIGNFHAL